MALAWEMLEMARLIYASDEAHGGAAAHADQLADCHMYIADILCEQVCGQEWLQRAAFCVVQWLQRI